MPEIQTLTQLNQWGLEAIHGTTPGGGANRLFPTLQVDLDPDFAANQYAASGNRFDSASVPAKEKSHLKLTGPMSYVEMAYVFAMLYGDPVITTPANAVLARKLSWPVALSGIIDGRTFYVQKGDSARARAVNYASLAGLTLEVDRDKCTLSGDGFAQRIQTGVTLTATPTALEEREIQPTHWNVYLDSSAATIGTTLLTRCYAMKWAYTDAQKDNWPLGRANTSFATALNTKPKLAVTLSMMADAVAEALYVQARAAQKVYIRYEAIGGNADNIQSLSMVGGSPTGGSFIINYKGQSTAAITFNSTTHHPTAAEVQSALELLSTIGTGNAPCTGGPLDSAPIKVNLQGPVNQDDATAMTVTNSVTPSGVPTFAAPVTVPYTFVLDMAAVPDPKNYGDMDGAYTVDMDLHIINDFAWTLAGAGGTAMNMYLIDKLTAVN